MSFMRIITMGGGGGGGEGELELLYLIKHRDIALFSFCEKMLLGFLLIFFLRRKRPVLMF